MLHQVSFYAASIVYIGTGDLATVVKQLINERFHLEFIGDNFSHFNVYTSII